MTTANYLINALAAQDKDEANVAFESMIQDKLADHLEVRKVELASGIMDDLQESSHTHQVVYSVPGEGKEKQYYHVTADDEDHAKEQLMDAQPTAKIHKVEKINEGEGMDAQRRWVRQVAAIGKEGSMKPMHRADLKKAARKYYQSRQPHGAQFVDQGAGFVRDARKSLKAKRLQGEEAIVEGGPTRKHFQQTADLIKQIEHPEKRKEMANHHASLFATQNPRFNKSKFMSAAGVSEAMEGGSKSSSSTTSSMNRNVLTNIRRAVQQLRVQGVNPTIAAAGHRDFGKLAAKHPKSPGYMLLRKLAPNKAQAVQNLTQAGVPLGGALEAHPNDFNQALQRIKRFK